MLVALNEEFQLLAGEYQFAEVVRDGLVLDYLGAIDLLSKMKSRLERRLGRELTHAASGFPPGVSQVEVRAVANVLEAVGLHCTRLVDEPTAANSLLGITEGAIVDVGGGTTGIAILQAGEVVYTADEPTGGTHFTLVIAGAQDITFEAAEAMKIVPSEQARLFPIVRPVMEKVGEIISSHIAESGAQVDSLTLVGGTCAFLRMAEVIEEYTGLPTHIPVRPVFVTPLGIAMHDHAE